MNLSEYLEKARKILGNEILKEHAGSEGMQYILEYVGNIPQLGDNVIIESLESKNGNKQCKIIFPFPRDYGFTLQTLKDAKVDVKSLQLLF